MSRTAWRRATCLSGLAALVSAGFALIAGPAGAVTVSTEAELQTAFADATETSIVLANSIDLTCAGGGDLDRNSATALTVDGNGFTIRQTCVGERVMQNSGSGALTLNAVTITGGTNSSGNGGGILSSAPVTITNSDVTGNTTAVNGGGIATNGTLTITSSHVTGNTASNDGGGANVQGGALDVTESTFSDNTATNGSGGAAFRDGSGGGGVTLVRSTLDGNQAPTPGQGSGAIDSLRPLTAINSTVTRNSGNTGGLAVAGSGIDMTLVYTTVVANTSISAGGANLAKASANIVTFGSVIALPAGGPNCDFSGASTMSNGFNFSDDPSCGLTSTGDTQNGGDPGLGGLAGNGGPTQTRLPQPGSPLANAIPTGSCQADGAAGITNDQRGLPRPALNGCDIGAVELQASQPGAPSAAMPVAAVPRFTG
jgi:Putative pectate lyase-like adhesive domain